MRYDLKIKIGDIEMLEARDTSIVDNIPSAEPQITNVTLINNACSGTMTIGATASDMLQFDILNPYKTSFDGDIATLYVREQEDLSQSTLSTIEEAVGDTVTSEVLSAEVETITSDYTEEEADIDAEDEADAEAVDATMESGLDALLEGEVPEEEAEDEGEDTDTEWTAVGVFYVYSQADNQDKSIRLTCYDGFSQMTGYYTPTNRTATIGAMFADLQAKALANCEITIDDNDFGDYASTSITWSIVTTYREALSYFAGIAGGFAEFLPNGHVGISQYSFDDNNVISDELIGYQESSAGEMVIESIECNRAPGELDEDTIESGEGGQTLHFANPFITQSMLDDIAADYLGIRFTGAKFTTDWNTNMTAGEFVRIFSKAEYENYLKLRNNVEQNSGSMSADELARIKAGMNALGRVALISTQTITFKGGAFTAVTSICDSEAEKASTPLGPTDAKFRKVYAEVVETKELVAEKASIADLEAAEARIGTLETDNTNVKGRLTAAEGQITSLEADHVSVQDLNAAKGRISTLETDSTNVKGRLTAAEADIGTLEADHVSVSDLTAANANITALQTGKADIDAANITTATIRDAWVDKILVQSGLIAHTGTIYSLDAIQVNASNIKAGTLDVERLIVTQNGQKYLVHVDGTTTTYEKLDGNIIEDLTITADKIVAGAITAQKITTENLVGTGGWINLRNGTFNYVNATSGQGISWDGTNLNISGVVTITGGNVYTKTEADSTFLTDVDVSVTQTSSGADITINGDTVSIANGAKGEQGIQGIQGETGPPGPAGSDGNDGVSVTNVTSTNNTADGGTSVVTVTLSNGTTKTFNVKNGNKGSTGDTAQWFYGTALTHTSGTATATVSGAVVGSMYLNTSTSFVYKCTAISGSNMTWTYAGELTSGVMENLTPLIDEAKSIAKNVDTKLNSDYLTAEAVMDAIDVASQQKVDRAHANGVMEWSENALHISNTYNNAYYETEIGGEGIDFKYGANAETANTVASITKDQLIIHKTIVLKEMLVGESSTQRGLWAWNVRENQHLQLKWKGDN